MNCPLPGGQGDADYGVVFHDLFLPAARLFAPDLVIVSAGFDAHARDPLADMRVSELGYAAMTGLLAQLAAETCGGKLVLLLEGGYDLGALSASVRASLEALRGTARRVPRRTRQRNGPCGRRSASGVASGRAADSRDVTVTSTGELDAAAKRLPWSFGSGPLVARVYGRVLAAVMLVAWLSLGVQVRVLLGSRGLLPAADFVAAVRAEPSATFFDLPSLFRWGASDSALVAGVVAGAALSLLAFAGVARRLCFAVSTLLYLSYVAVGRDFLSFQWDNLLLECGLLASFLPSERPAPLVHFLFRLLAFKLYFESGIAKWQSPVHDWQDGGAMTAYYETAPPADPAGVLRPSPSGLVAPPGKPGDASAGAVGPVLHLRPSPGSAVCRCRLHAVSDPQPLHRQLWLLLLPGPGAASVSSRRRRPGTTLGKAARRP